MYRFFRRMLFNLEPEQAHDLSLWLMSWAGRLLPVRILLSRIFSTPPRPVEAFGLRFSNPIGLAAGYDKDGFAWRGLACLGFGHIEVGTVTRLPQPGNPKPRVFRLVEDRAIINRMGFPGRGANSLLEQLQSPRPKGMVLGVNIGKSKDTPLEDANQDYLFLLGLFASVADYIAINVSSPNTEGLRRLQARRALDSLLHDLAEERSRLVNTGLTGRHNLPLLVKLAPDLTSQELDDALVVIQDRGMDGVIATNTTLQRPELSSAYASERGGLSGAPLFHSSLEMVRQIQVRTQGNLPIIGVGGIENTTGVRMMLDAGAVLVQVYTGLVYQGPALVKRILREL